MPEAPVTGPSHPNTPAPMETGGVEDGQTWAEQVETSAEVKFQWARPLKHPRSQSSRLETGPRLPFPLQDEEGRLASIERLYEYAGEQPFLRDDVAGQAIRHLHPEILPGDAQRLGNQVSCMIAEYHLTSSTRVSTTMCQVLPEAAKLLLPAIKTYVSSISFEGTQDVRVLDHAKTLRVAVWLHRLDMAVGGDQSASETLDASRHCLGCLLESFLIPATQDLTFREVVAHCLYENQRDTQHHLNDLVRCRNRVCKELNDLVEAHKGASGSSQKRIKKEIDIRCKDLENLKGRLSHEESYLQEDMPEQDIPECDDPLAQGAEVVMPPDSGVDNAPLESPWLQSPAHLLVRMLPWRWMRGPSAHLPLAQSPKRMMISLMRLRQWKWRQAWPTSQSCLPVDKSGRVRVPPSLKNLPLWKVKKSNCRFCRPLSRGIQRRSCTDDPMSRR